MPLYQMKRVPGDGNFVVVAPGAASGSAVSAAIAALGLAGGRVELAAGAHTWDSIPAIPPNLSGLLTISGAPDAVVSLTPAAPRFIDFARTDNHQVFRRWRLENLRIDAGGVGGKHHVIVGTYINGTTMARVNFEDGSVEDVVAYNIPTDNTLATHRLGIALNSFHVASGEPTENTITGIKVKGVKIFGGNAGVLIGGNGPDSGVNVWLDEIDVEDTEFDGLVTPTVFYASSGLHIGGKGYGGRVKIARCKSKNTGDNGIEVNAFDNAVVEDSVVVDAANVGFYSRNFHALRDTELARLSWENCRVEVNSIVPTRASNTYGRGFMLPEGVGNAFGEVNQKNCYVTVKSPGEFHAPGYGFAVNGVPVRRLHLDVTVSVTNAAVTPSLAVYPTIAVVHPLGSCHTTGDIRLKVSGAQSGGAVASVRGATIGGSDHTLDLSVSGDIDMPGVQNNQTMLVNIGELTPTAISGNLRVRAERMQGDAGPRGVRIRAATQINESLNISGNFRGMTGGVEVVVDDAALRPKIHLSEFVWRVAPGSSAKTVSGSPYTYQNVSMYPEIVTVAANGATVSQIAQSAGAGAPQPTGALAGQFLLQNGDSLVVSYTGGPPVVRAQPGMPLIS